MDNPTKINFTLGERLEEMLMDSPDIFYQISNTPMRQEDQVEIQAELSAAISPDIILGQVSRWLDLQKLLDKDLRVYLWSSNKEVEKYITAVVANMDHLFITILPTYLKGEFIHDA